MLWYASIRTRYVKLVSKKSGDGAGPETELTDRDEWIMAHFGFIQKFIRKSKKKVTVSVSIVKLLDYFLFKKCKCLSVQLYIILVTYITSCYYFLILLPDIFS